jgi:hypothetical protein
MVGRSVSTYHGAWCRQPVHGGGAAAVSGEARIDQELDDLAHAVRAQARRPMHAVVLAAKDAVARQQQLHQVVSKGDQPRQRHRPAPIEHVSQAGIE